MYDGLFDSVVVVGICYCKCVNIWLKACSDVVLCFVVLIVVVGGGFIGDCSGNIVCVVIIVSDIGCV